MTLQTLVLSRDTHCLCDLHRLVPRFARIIWVRYTRKNLTVLYRPAK